MPLDREQICAGPRVPYFGCVIPTASDNPLAVGGKCDGPDRIRVPTEREKFLAGFCIPHLCGAIGAGGDDLLAVRRIGHGKNRRSVPVENLQLLAYLALPKIPLEPPPARRRGFLQQLLYPADVVLLPRRLNQVHFRHIQLVFGTAPLPGRRREAYQQRRYSKDNRACERWFASAPPP